MVENVEGVNIVGSVIFQTIISASRIQKNVRIASLESTLRENNERERKCMKQTWNTSGVR